MNENTRFSSMHTHTLFCDGKDDIETMCRAAYEKNLFAVGFSAHAPIEKQIGRESDWNLKDKNVNEYVSQVNAAKQRWEGKLKVFLGYEADYIKNRRSPADSDITALNLDYIIGSVHYLYHEKNEFPFTVDGPKEEFITNLNEGYNGSGEKLMHYYYDAVLEMIEKGGFDILGHADLLKKNSQGMNYWREETELERQKEVALAAAKTGIVIEVNTGGINRKKINDLYPSLAFLRMIQELNIPVIITADAHNASQIDGNYNFALNTLKLANIKEHLLFNGKIDNKTSWLKEII